MTNTQLYDGDLYYMRVIVLGLAVALLTGCAGPYSDNRATVVPSHADKMHFARSVHKARSKQASHQTVRPHHLAALKPATKVRGRHANHTLTLKKAIKPNPTYVDIQRAIRDSEHSYESPRQQLRKPAKTKKVQSHIDEKFGRVAVAKRVAKKIRSQ